MKFNKMNKKGFTLTEVMIGMMILTIAIVAATNLLISLIRANESNVKSMQAFYLAQEGIELVRNVRDTNWIHNLSWVGDTADQEGLWSGKLDGDFTVDILKSSLGFDGSKSPSTGNLIDLKQDAPVKFDASLDQEILRYDGYLSSEGTSGESTGFVRNINVTPYTENVQCAASSEVQCVLVTSAVKWKLGNKDQQLVLQEILTNWKGGAL